MNAINIRELQLEDENAFLAMTQASREFHLPWVSAPLTHDEFVAYIQRYQQPTHKSFIVVNQDAAIVGVYNISEIVRGNFQSAYLGFYGSVAFSGKGLMSEALQLVLKEVFTTMGLHRLEANIQPGNEQSLSLIKRNGFRKEGFSPKYLKINHEWSDHERWAMTIEDWQKEATR
jgi:ribosomal-protein-alanine N-acetyltransferase